MKPDEAHLNLLIGRPEMCHPLTDRFEWMPIICRQAMHGQLSVELLANFVKGARRDLGAYTAWLSESLASWERTAVHLTPAERRLLDDCANLRRGELIAYQASLLHLERYLESGNVVSLNLAADECAYAREERDTFLLTMRRLVGSLRMRVTDASRAA